MQKRIVTRHLFALIPAVQHEAADVDPIERDLVVEAYAVGGILRDRSGHQCQKQNPRVLDCRLLTFIAGQHVRRAQGVSVGLHHLVLDAEGAGESLCEIGYVGHDLGPMLSRLPGAWTNSPAPRRYSGTADVDW